MASIFLSYSRADRPKAQVIAEALIAEGFVVWWDKALRAGQTYDEVTEDMLRESDAVVVLWSTVSVKSKWVRAEATLGQRTLALVPAMIEDANRPIMFELTQSADLIGWDADRGDPR
ncbi:toll/interleukin-1 receptor domain-containing protein [Hyphomonas sp.]|uniref:toll/interleukin-1 receptor domain-containing protein n=1 Tax=Hyphomonas sp. TaxID=87 RepID=UPI00333FE569